MRFRVEVCGTSKCQAVTREVRFLQDKKPGFNETMLIGQRPEFRVVKPTVLNTVGCRAPTSSYEKPGPIDPAAYLSQYRRLNYPEFSSLNAKQFMFTDDIDTKQNRANLQMGS